MTALDVFLCATDMDDLLRASDEVKALNPDDVARIGAILVEWRDHQAVANLLFHPRIIPDDLRNEAVNRALRATDAPYLNLAAIVGLQSTAPDTIPEPLRSEWRQILLNMLESDIAVIAGRASVTMFSWFRQPPVPSVLSLYPVKDETASKNIRAFALALYGDLSTSDFAQRISAAGVAPGMLRSFTSHHQEFVRGSAPGAGFMKCPLYSFIPNLSDFCPTPICPTPNPRPWWRFW